MYEDFFIFKVCKKESVKNEGPKDLLRREEIQVTSSTKITKTVDPELQYKLYVKEVSFLLLCFESHEDKYITLELY